MLVPAAELPDPNALAISTTLLPGTVIFTGTPEGVGMTADPPRWLKTGDQVEITIEGIGTLRNPVVVEGAGG